MAGMVASYRMADGEPQPRQHRHGPAGHRHRRPFAGAGGGDLLVEELLGVGLALYWSNVRKSPAKGDLDWGLSGR
jgi:hypothetical protein